MSKALKIVCALVIPALVLVGCTCQPYEHGGHHHPMNEYGGK